MEKIQWVLQWCIVRCAAFLCCFFLKFTGFSGDSTFVPFALRNISSRNSTFWLMTRCVAVRSNSDDSDDHDEHEQEHDHHDYNYNNYNNRTYNK